MARVHIVEVVKLNRTRANPGMTRVMSRNEQANGQAPPPPGLPETDEFWLSAALQLFET